ncbi:MAG: hypothetical protein ACLFV3_09240 [Phycisphaeraceae bacterium]
MQIRAIPSLAFATACLMLCLWVPWEAYPVRGDQATAMGWSWLWSPPAPTSSLTRIVNVDSTRWLMQMLALGVASAAGWGMLHVWAGWSTPARRRMAGAAAAAVALGLLITGAGYLIKGPADEGRHIAEGHAQDEQPIRTDREAPSPPPAGYRLLTPRGSE